MEVNYLINNKKKYKQQTQFKSEHICSRNISYIQCWYQFCNPYTLYRIINKQNYIMLVTMFFT